MKIPQPIPYQGSKRALAPLILRYFPDDAVRLIEPFAGSAAISVAAALKKKAQQFIINDLNTPLISLLKEIVNDPDSIGCKYKLLWEEQLGSEKEFFYKIRQKFNSDPKPEYFLYLMARCVKGAVRYNSSGEFNQSPDNRRKGKRPENMLREIHGVSYALKGKSSFIHDDFTKVLEMARPNDIVYMDPPYQGTSGKKDPRYFQSLDIDDFANALFELDKRNISFIISYDGKTGGKTYGKSLPVELNLKRILVDAGLSSQSTLLGRKEVTVESLYLSRSLVERIGTVESEEICLKSKQLALISPNGETRNT